MDASESCMATDLAHLTSHIAQAVVTTGKVAGAVGKGALEGLFDVVKIPVDMAMHPIETAKGLGHLAVVAKNLAMGDVQTRQKFQDMLTACKQLPFEQKAEHLTRFVVGVLAPGPVALTRSAGFAKGLMALGNAIGKEVAAVKAGLNALVQASRPERALSVAGTKIIQKLPASVLREAENVAKSRPVVELVKKVESTTQQVIKVANMGEFFEKTAFGRSVEQFLQKTNIRYQGQAIFEVTKDINRDLQKGYHLYLDALHKDHLEVFNKRGKFVGVLNLDGSVNAQKTASAIREARKLTI